jgi:hypothetical protein
MTCFFRPRGADAMESYRKAHKVLRAKGHASRNNHLKNKRKEIFGEKNSSRAHVREPAATLIIPFPIQPILNLPLAPNIELLGKSPREFAQPIAALK